MIQRRFSAFAVLLPLAVVAAGCTPSAIPDVPVKVVDAAQVAQCAYVENISERPGVYGMLATQGQDYARKGVLEEAAKAGANTVVFDKVEPGSMVTEVTATAYRC